MRHAEITGWGKCVPPAVLTNDDLASVIDTDDEWITSRSGIKERHISHVETSDLAAVAGLRAIAAAGLEPDDIDLVIAATCSPDRLVPSAASFIQDKIGAVNAGTFDLNAACSGFVYGMSVGSSMIATGAASRVLLIGVEKLSYYIDLADRSTAVLFGDGAGAVVLEPTEEPVGLLSSTLGSDGSLRDILTVYDSGTETTIDAPPGASNGIVMDGREVFRRAVVAMGEAATEVVAAAGLTADDVDLLIPHQANIRIIDATARRLDLAPEKVYTNIASYGNTSAASIPMALCDALDEGRIRPGANLVLVAFGGGLTWAGAVVRWGERVTPLGTSDAELPPTDTTALDLLRTVEAHRR